ncbi:unnamed protein product [Caenorhabditis sp. 36 PRJEB53466]|nr:unnamed protein product [Caenorhabditis sp. 36 PRJEB53466]
MTMKNTSIKGYNLIRELGAGSYGEVYLVSNSKNETVVLKTLDEDDETAENEREALIELNGINGIPPLLDYFHTRKHKCFILPLGGTDLNALRAKIPGRAFPVSMVHKTLFHLVKILQDMNARGWLHGDIKADNLVLHRETLQLTLIDFGFGFRFRDKNGNRVAWRSPIADAIHSSPFADVYKKVTPLDDLMQAIFLGLQLRCLAKLIYDQDFSKASAKKHKFIAQPRMYLPASELPIVFIYEKILVHKFEQEPDFDGVRTAIEDERRRAVGKRRPGFAYDAVADLLNFD